MPGKQKSVVSMRLSDGTIIDSWTRLSLRDTFTDPLGSYEFELRPGRDKIREYSDKIRKGDLIGVKVDEVTQGSYLIQSVNRRMDRDGVSFQVECQSVLATTYEANVDPDISKAYKSDTPVSTVILEAMSPYGFSVLVGNSSAWREAKLGKKISKAKSALQVDAIKHKDCQAQEGESVYAFCSRIFNRLGCALHVNHKGELMLTAPDYEQQPSYTLVQDFDGSNPGDRMLDGFSIDDSNEGQFSECVVRGVAGDSGGQTRSTQPIGRVVTADPVVSLGSEAFAAVPRHLEDFGGHTYRSVASVAPYKPRFIRDKNARDKDRCINVAKLVLGMAASKAYVLTCEVDGMRSKDGKVWTVDTIATVVIEAFAINEPMWILERTLVIDRNGGQKTRLKLIPVGSLVLGDLPS